MRSHSQSFTRSFTNIQAIVYHPSIIVLKSLTIVQICLILVLNMIKKAYLYAFYSYSSFLWSILYNIKCVMQFILTIQRSQPQSYLSNISWGRVSCFVFCLCHHSLQEIRLRNLIGASFLFLVRYNSSNFPRSLSLSWCCCVGITKTILA